MVCPILVQLGFSLERVFLGMTPSQGLTKIVLPLLAVVVSSTKPKPFLSNDFLPELIKSLSLLELGCDYSFLRLNSFLNT